MNKGNCRNSLKIYCIEFCYTRMKEQAGNVHYGKKGMPYLGSFGMLMLQQTDFYNLQDYVIIFLNYFGVIVINC